MVPNTPTNRLLVTGFRPFDGRLVNASWIAASQLQKQGELPQLLTAEIPVEWGKPERLLIELVKIHKPEIIVALGEGKPGCIQLETLALNRRVKRRDNNQALPEPIEVVTGGPGRVRSSAPLVDIRHALIDKGIPALLSTNAGSYLCEELLYILEHRCMAHPAVKLGIFVHLPPYGTSLHFKQQDRICDEELLLEFAQDLVGIVAIHC